MEINIEKLKIEPLPPAPITTEGGKTVKEAHAPGVEWIQVEFIHDMRIPWNWDDLLQDATKAEENYNLAMAGIILSTAAEFGAVKAEMILRQLGFDQIVSEHYLLSTETKNKVSEPARSFGHREIEKDGKKYHVICAVCKGTTTLPDTITDIKSVADGFFNAGRSCAESLKEYINKLDGATRENTILFITGHSLGASTANVLGRLCGDFAKDEATFVYTIASPNYETDGEANSGKSYPNFIYYTNTDDVVPKVPPRLPPRYFSKIGKEHLFNYTTLDQNQKQRFLRAYQYFRNLTFEEDTDLLGLGLLETETLPYKLLKNHLTHTYMSFLLSELTDSEIDRYLPT